MAQCQQCTVGSRSDYAWEDEQRSLWNLSRFWNGRVAIRGECANRRQIEVLWNDKAAMIFGVALIVGFLGGGFIKLYLFPTLKALDLSM